MNIQFEHTNELTTRYAMYDRPVNGLRNVLLDSFMPKYFKNMLSGRSFNNEQEFPSTFAAISELTSDLMNVPLIPRSELFRLVGYSEKDLKDLLSKVASKKLTMNMLGFGGTGANTLYWLYEMSVLCNVSNIFKKINILEPDNIEHHNLLRMPMSSLRNIDSLYLSATRYKQELALVHQGLRVYTKTKLTGSTPLTNTTNLPHLSEMVDMMENNNYDGNSMASSGMFKFIRHILLNQPIKANSVNSNIGLNLSKLMLVDCKYQKLASSPLGVFPAYFLPGAYTNSYNYNKRVKRRDYVQISEGFFYGAPDITTRQAMASRGLPLITATHGDDDASLSLNPSQDSMFQRESYGMIKLSVFFMNQIRLAIGLLEYLASDFDMTESKSLLEYSYPRDAKPLPTKRQWHMQLEHSGTMEDN